MVMVGRLYRRGEGKFLEVNRVVALLFDFGECLREGTVGARRQTNLIRISVHEPIRIEFGGKLLFTIQYILQFEYAGAREGLPSDQPSVHITFGNLNGVVC